MQYGVRHGGAGPRRVAYAIGRREGQAAVRPAPYMFQPKRRY
jgi:hypothetical protein